jgi:hypothetical protein
MIRIFHGNNPQIYTDAKSELPKDFDSCFCDQVDIRDIISQLVGISLFGVQKPLILQSIDVSQILEILAYEFSREVFILVSSYVTKEDQKSLEKKAKQTKHELLFVEKKPKALEKEKPQAFDWLLTFFAKDKKKAWLLFPQYVDEKETLLLVGSFWWAIKVLLCIKSGQTQEISEYTLRQYRSVEKKWTQTELENLVISLLEVSKESTKEEHRHRCLERFTLSL